MSWLDLKTLPHEHPLRNTLLGELHVERKWNGWHPDMKAFNDELLDNMKPTWKRILPTWKVAKNTFNEMGAVWVVTADWRVLQ